VGYSGQEGLRPRQAVQLRARANCRRHASMGLSHDEGTARSFGHHAGSLLRSRAQEWGQDPLLGTWLHFGNTKIESFLSQSFVAGRFLVSCIVGSTQNFLGRSVESIGQQSPRAVFRLLSRLSTTMGVCAIVKNDLGIVSGRLMQ